MHYQQNCYAAVALLPQSITDTATVGTAIDTQAGGKCSHVTIFLMAGAIGAADFDAKPKISECETSGGSYTDITGATVNGAAGGVILQTEDNGIWRWDIPITGARKRFLKLNVDPGNAATLLAGLALMWGLPNAPTSAATAGLVDWTKLA